MWVFVFCICSSIWSIIHYGIIPSTERGKTFCIIEIFRYTIFFLTCFYYSHKAKKLITYKEECVSMLKVMFCLILLTSIVLAIFIDMEIMDYEDTPNKSKYNPDNIDPADLCAKLEFQFFRWMPLVMCAAF